MDLVEVIWNQSSFSGNANRILALKLKNLKFRLRAWNKMPMGYFKEERKRCLDNIKAFDVLEED